MLMNKSLFDAQTNAKETADNGSPKAFFVPESLHQGRLQAAVALISRLHGVGTILDVGCGYGDLYPLLHDHFPGVSYVGIDPVEWVVDKAAEKLEAYPHVELYCGGIEDFTYEHRFDVVVSLGALAMISRESVPAFIAALYAHADRAVVLEWQDSRKYKGSFTAFTPDEIIKETSNYVRVGNSISREGDSAVTSLITL